MFLELKTLSGRKIFLYDVISVSSNLKSNLFIFQDSLQVIPNAYLDRSVKGAKFLDRFQFERIGFFSVDKDTTPGKVSRIVKNYSYKSSLQFTSCQLAVTKKHRVCLLSSIERAPVLIIPGLPV